MAISVNQENLDRFADLRRECTRDPDAQQYMVHAVDLALRKMALPYSDHADYDEAWRP